MKIKHSLLLIILSLWIIPVNAFAASRTITVNWSMPSSAIGDIQDYILNYSTNSDMSGATQQSCEPWQQTGTENDQITLSMTCNNVPIITGQIAYFTLEAIKTDGSSLTSSVFTKDTKITLVQNFSVLTPSSEASPAVISISNLSPDNYTFSNIELNGTIYVDRDYIVTDLPSELQGIHIIKTANNDKYNNTSSFMTFTLNNNATIYIVYDSRATTYPTWLQNEFTRSDLTITTTDSSGSLTYTVWYKSSQTSSITIPGNMNGDPVNVGSMYFVLLK